MPTILAQISPQRSTQYTNIAKRLAPIELGLSPVGQYISSIDRMEIGERDYLKLNIKKQLDEQELYELGGMSMTSSFFHYYENLEPHEGPFLKPISIQSVHELPYDLIITRRYKGKTNEMFTHFMCNIAKYSSFSHMLWRDIRIFDPLAGGGTTLFIALYLGAEAAGVEKRSKDVQSTVSFIKQYTKEHGIPCLLKEEKIQRTVKRHWLTIGKEIPRRLLLVKGETTDSSRLISGFKKVHCIVTDLPYGIQHRGKTVDLLLEALPVWSSLLIPGGTIAMSWDSSRFPRKKMTDLIRKAGNLTVLEGYPYEEMSHRVDRVIKERDVVVACASTN